MADIRCFIGLPVPDPVASAALEMQETVSHRAPEAFRWVARESLHVTLGFLGDVPEQRVEELVLALNAIKHPRFGLRLGKLIALPKPSVPRVLAMTLEGDLESVRALADHVRAVASPFGSHQETKPFLAHLTIGRLRRTTKGMGKEAQAALGSQRFGPAPSWRADRVLLLKSHLEDQGPRYEPLAEFLLQSP